MKRETRSGSRSWVPSIPRDPYLPWGNFWPWIQFFHQICANWGKHYQKPKTGIANLGAGAAWGNDRIGAVVFIVTEFKHNVGRQYYTKELNNVSGILHPIQKVRNASHWILFSMYWCLPAISIWIASSDFEVWIEHHFWQVVAALSWDFQMAPGFSLQHYQGQWKPNLSI